MSEKKVIGEMKGIGYKAGMEPIYQEGDKIYVPPNCGGEWAKQFLTKEDWEKINEELEKIDEPVKFKISVGGVKLKLYDHPDGSDRGGYVPTLFFENVYSYNYRDHNKLNGTIQIYHDDIDGEWR